MRVFDKNGKPITGKLPQPIHNGLRLLRFVEPSYKRPEGELVLLNPASRELLRANPYALGMHIA